MEHWKVIFSGRMEDNIVRLNPQTGKPETVTSVFKKLKIVADAAYECPHRVITYRLRADEGDVYYLPHPMCTDCRVEMTLTSLWGVETGLAVDGFVAIGAIEE